VGGMNGDCGEPVVRERPIRLGSSWTQATEGQISGLDSGTVARYSLIMDPHYLAPSRALLVPVILLLYLGIGVAEPVHHVMGGHPSQALVVVDWTTGDEERSFPPAADYDCTLCQAQDRAQPETKPSSEPEGLSSRDARGALARPFRGPAEVPSPRPRGPPQAA
jgi:hypothetical protein